MNHYDKKLTKAREVSFVGVDVDMKTYKQKMEQDLTYLSRYAKPLPAKKKKIEGGYGWYLLWCCYLVQV